MKGFGIYVKNNLLEPKHVEKMGVTLWLYLWLLDKMTSVDEQGVGIVLGGRPIEHEKDIRPELGVPERTYYRWLDALRNAGYVNTRRASRGVVITVNKAEKIWGKLRGELKSERPKVAGQKSSDLPKVATRPAKSGRVNSQKWQNDLPKTAALYRQYKTIQDNTETESKALRASQSILDDPTTMRALQEKFSALNVREELEAMRDYLVSRGRRYRDYVAFARNWLRRTEAERRRHGELNEEYAYCPGCGTHVSRHMLDKHGCSAAPSPYGKALAVRMGSSPAPQPVL